MPHLPITSTSPSPFLHPLVTLSTAHQPNLDAHPLPSWSLDGGVGGRERRATWGLYGRYSTWSGRVPVPPTPTTRVFNRGKSPLMLENLIGIDSGGRSHGVMVGDWGKKSGLGWKQDK
ncbi:hypothetical protein E2C01_100671 [Portunus trituberculatus]|uniref:Uncharacterized protein n=1 Tax=Portunus trituberculatus TaxID=210409 RepID=A0A5B7KDM2_PORTR|nr:hypothetical protein [Portunus trituberculatus]